MIRTPSQAPAYLTLPPLAAELGILRLRVEELKADAKLAELG